ncbi:hypothetical protein FQR65_LT04873 [Abscondita terminalis]|nr:hypothetical protein FQR65_LT04873 [Abscondita terminalis]
MHSLPQEVIKEEIVKEGIITGVKKRFEMKAEGVEQRQGVVVGTVINADRKAYKVMVVYGQEMSETANRMEELEERKEGTKAFVGSDFNNRIVEKGGLLEKKEEERIGDGYLIEEEEEGGVNENVMEEVKELRIGKEEKSDHLPFQLVLKRKEKKRKRKKKKKERKIYEGKAP